MIITDEEFPLSENKCEAYCEDCNDFHCFDEKIHKLKKYCFDHTCWVHMTCMEHNSEPEELITVSSRKDCFMCVFDIQKHRGVYHFTGEIGWPKPQGK